MAKIYILKLLIAPHIHVRKNKILRLKIKKDIKIRCENVLSLCLTESLATKRTKFSELAQINY
jgi:hypothetical protein